MPIGGGSSTADATDGRRQGPSACSAARASGPLRDRGSPARTHVITGPWLSGAGDADGEALGVRHAPALGVVAPGEQPELHAPAGRQLPALGVGALAGSGAAMRGVARLGRSGTSAGSALVPASDCAGSAPSASALCGRRRRWRRVGWWTQSVAFTVSAMPSAGRRRGLQRRRCARGYCIRSIV